MSTPVTPSNSLIVIAHHNGSEYLPALLDSLVYPALVVDTGSSPEEQNCLRRQSVRSLFIGGGGCTEAYREGFRNSTPDIEHFFFMHDSMRVKEREFLPLFAHHSPVTAWIGFNMDWGPRTSPEAVWGASWLGALTTSNPPHAIFGPIFYAHQSALLATIFHAPHLWPPALKSRVELQGAERGLAYTFHRAGFTPKYLEEYDNNRLDVTRDYRFFDKYRPNRA